MASIYILDDNSAVRSSLEILFGFLFNADIRAYSRVEDLYAQLDRLPPGVLLVDQQMPECSGIDVIRTLARRTDRRLSLILMSGSVDATLIEDAKAAGAGAVIEKPCSTDMLRQVIRRSHPRMPLRAAPIMSPSPTVRPMSSLSL